MSTLHCQSFVVNALSVFYGDIGGKVTVNTQKCSMVSSLFYGDAEVSVNAVLSKFCRDAEVSVNQCCIVSVLW